MARIAFILLFFSMNGMGQWREYKLTQSGDTINRVGQDGTCRYFTADGSLKSEQGWKALDPDKEFDTVDVEDPDHPDTYRQVAIRNEGASIKHGLWRYYDTRTGMIIREQTYQLGKLEPALSAPSGNTVKSMVDTPKISTKPKEVLEFEKKNEGKKRLKVRDGSTSG